MKMVRHAAEVLNATDDLEYRMRVMLFQQENAWPYVEGEWNPGDFLHPTPSRRREFNQDTGSFEMVAIGNFPRPMIDEYDIDPYIVYEDSFGDEYIGSGDEIRLTGRPACVSCQVDWEGDEPCFVCGAPAPDGNSYNAFEYESELRDLLIPSWSDFATRLQEELRLRLNEEVDRVVIYGEDNNRLHLNDQMSVYMAYAEADIRSTERIYELGFDRPIVFTVPNELGDHQYRVIYNTEPIRLTPIRRQVSEIQGARPNYVIFDEAQEPLWGRSSSEEPSEPELPARFQTFGRVNNLSVDDPELLPGPVRPVFNPSDYENRGSEWPGIIAEWQRIWARRWDGRR